MGKQIGAFFGGGDAGSEAAAAQAAANAAAQAELRRQFEETQENLQPFITAGQEALPLVTEGTTAGGLAGRLSRIFDTDIFSRLVDERTRAARGQLAAGGLTRSGAGLETIAAIPTNIGLALEEMLTGRATGLAGTGANVAQGLGALGAQTSAGLANLFSQTGGAQASGILADQQAAAAGGRNILNMAATAASIFFSDISIKSGLQRITDLCFEHPQIPGEMVTLGVFQWQWSPKTKGTMIERCGNIGFIAQDVQKVLPDYVSEYGGFLCIDYPRLLDDICPEESEN